MDFARAMKRLCAPFAMAVPPAATSGVPAAGGETIVDVLARASERARDAAVEYIGLATAQEVNRLMQATRVHLIDVRAKRERQRAGELPGSIPIEWRSKGAPAVDERFIANLGERLDREEIVIFVSGRGRSSDQAARAAAMAGYMHALSVIDGFDGMRPLTAGLARKRGTR